jgi:hypothetical protein
MKRIIYMFGLFAFLVFASGCKKDWLSELGTNPNQPSEAPVQLLLPPVLSEFAAREVSTNTPNTPIGVWMGYGSYSGSYSIDDNTLTYYVNQGSPTIWNYYDVLKNAQYIETTASAMPNMDYYVAVAKILKAFGFQKLVDAYGKVPYSEAFQGVGNFFPKYDDAQEVYNANLAQLDSAIALIQNADAANAVAMTGNDILYQGDMDKWLKFANTIKLQYLIRESSVIGAAGGTEIAKTASIGFITDDANVNPGYLNSAGKQNPLWARYGIDPGGAQYSDGYKYLRAGGAGVDFLKSNNDLRLFKIYAPKGGMSPDNADFFELDDDPNNYVGIYYGDRPAATKASTNGTSGIGNGVLSGFDAPVALISAAQSYFLQSEATLKGWLDGGDAKAKELYESGITASFETLGVEDADDAAETYYSQAVDYVGWDASPNKLKAIITQKWISMAFTDPMEAWAEYRRTGYPSIDILPETKFPGYGRHMPTILWYPKSESDTNQENYKSAGGPTTDPQNQKLFWAK